MVEILLIMTHQTAIQAAENVRQQTNVQWRLPNIQELASLIEDKCGLPAINLTIFPNLHAISIDRWVYWSATPGGRFFNSARNISFGQGDSGSTSRTNS